jgi:hypothetical protein
MTTADMHNRLVIVLSYSPKEQCIDKQWCSFPIEGSDEVELSVDTLLTQYRALGDLLVQRSLRDSQKCTQTATVSSLASNVSSPVRRLAQVSP